MPKIKCRLFGCRLHVTRTEKLRHEWSITVECQNCQSATVYIGSGTVWRAKDTGSRAGISTEGWLADVAWKADREDATDA